MLTWEQYDADTWGAEWLDQGRLALVKRVAEDQYAIIAGTFTELEWSGESEGLSDAQAKAARFLLLANNCDDKQLRRLKYKV